MDFKTLKERLKTSSMTDLLVEDFKKTYYRIFSLYNDNGVYSLTDSFFQTDEVFQNSISKEYYNQDKIVNFIFSIKDNKPNLVIHSEFEIKYLSNPVMDWNKNIYIQIDSKTFWINFTKY
jgi:hypothetical protein